MAAKLPDELKIVKHSQLSDLKVLRSGGFGVVYRAKHKVFGNVVYKQLKAEKLGDRLFDELRTEMKTRALKHDNIVAFFAIVFEEGHYGIVMELVLHGALDDFIYNYIVDWPLKLLFSHDIICGMSYLHSLQPPVIHSDLKCENILVSDAFVAKVADFGLAKWKQHAATQTASRKRSGTIAYMAPEILADARSTRTPKYDVYAFGILLWELLSEKVPYDSVLQFNNFFLFESHVLSGKRPSLDEIEGPVDSVALARKWIPLCWSQLRDDRPSFDDLEKPFADICRPFSSSSIRKMPPCRNRGAENAQLQDKDCFESCRPHLLKSVQLQGEVRGVAVLDNIMYVVCSQSSTILMYDVDTCSRLDTVINIEGVSHPNDMVVCRHDRQIYIADWRWFVWRVSAADHSYTRWLTAESTPSHTFSPLTLSVTSRRLLVTSEQSRTLHQFSADGQLRCAVSLPGYVRWLCHGVETSRDTLVVSYQGTEQDQRQWAVSEVDKAGTVLSTFTDLRWWPDHLSLDSNNCVLVADCNNHRILLLNSELQLRRVFLPSERGLFGSLANVFRRRESQVKMCWPRRLHYNPLTAQLYVVHCSSSNQWSPDVISVFQLQ